MRTCRYAVCLGLSLSLLGCVATDAPSDEPSDPPDVASLTTPEVARVTTADGGSWRFLEPEPGVLLLWAVLPERGATARPDLGDGLSYVQLYQRLTSAPVPRALREAQARADAQATLDPSPDDGGLVDDDSGKPDVAAGISAVGFQDEYCNPYDDYDYYYCWPSFYGSPFVQRKTYSMHGYVAAVNDTVDFRLRYKKVAAGSWKTALSAQALPGQVHHVQQIYFGYRRWRRFEVLDHGDDLLRYSAFGSD